ncbi:transcriptional regulator, AraC family [Filimonas lacunae]|uniref:Transcriptional regulator, AraC family n=1 Tax=Filimonas lacunae TaxID=477680 RepID=A0A173ME65_9BACT|nr:AraC family transcriptional regulator [Filimonas lacunae]BAV05728.1 transcriptional regulator, AraC family [Filimonas lacunae]SIT28775.1 transcriptional regulator, AraC family [Filimonas lacunae]
MSYMQTLHLYQPFELEYREVTEYVAREYKNTFFELIFVLAGKGIQTINKHQLPYAPDKLFLVFPQDTHGFEIHEPTRFFFIRFNSSYITYQPEEWVRKMELIFNTHNHLPGCLLKNVADKPLVRSLIEALQREARNEYPNKNEVVKQLMNTVITVAARNITLQAPLLVQHATDGTAAALINYIHKNIYQPDYLKADVIATHFNVAANYISEYFKKQVGESLQQYITTYKVKILETRLLHTNMQLVSMAEEFGFTDISHMNRIFKKYKGVSPSEFRRNRGAV